MHCIYYTYCTCLEVSKESYKSRIEFTSLTYGFLRKTDMMFDFVKMRKEGAVIQKHQQV